MKMNQTISNLRHRSEMVIGPTAMRSLNSVNIIIFGVGGVGSWCAEALVRSGAQNLTIVDSDIICATNLNRQLQSTSENIGNIKVDELQKRLLSINPTGNFKAINKVWDKETKDQFELEKYDYVIDAIDSLQNKLLLIEEAIRLNKKIFCSMGAGAKVNTSKIKKAYLKDTKVDPLAREVRTQLQKRGNKTKIPVVFSEEIPILPQVESFCGTAACSCTKDRSEQTVDWCAKKKRINGALVHITGIFGLTLSSMVIQDLMGIDPITDKLIVSDN